MKYLFYKPLQVRALGASNWFKEFAADAQSIAKNV